MFDANSFTLLAVVLLSYKPSQYVLICSFIRWICGFTVKERNISRTELSELLGLKPVSRLIVMCLFWHTLGYYKSWHYIDCLCVCLPYHLLLFASYNLLASFAYIFLFFIYFSFVLSFKNRPAPFPGWMS